MKIFKCILTALLFCFSCTILTAQEPMEAKKYDDPQWYWIVSVDYAPGQYDKAKKLITEYFMKAAEDAGTTGPAMVLEMSSGKYDAMYVWHMKDGIEGMNWQTSPDDVKWFQSLAKIAGSTEKAQEIWQEYESCISSSSSELARKAW